MLVVETIARRRREQSIKSKTIKEIACDLKVSRNTVRKVLRSGDSYGDQAMGTTLASVRSVVHALRGWPTPIGVTINSQKVGFDAEGKCADPEADARLRLMAGQVSDFARTAEVA